MNELIVTAKTLEQAIENAYEECARMGYSREEVSVEVIETPTKRLFFSSPAKVKAVYGHAEKPAEQPVPEKEKKEPPKTEQPAKEKPAEKKQPKPKKEAPKKEEKKQEQEAQPAAVQETVETQPASGEKVDAAVAYFKAVAAQMGVENLTVSPVQQGGTVILKVDGPNVGTLIGRRGETMESLSYLVSLAGNRCGGDYAKITLDVAGYRSKREKDLAALARRVGAKVQKTGRSHMFEPMNPYERRIIHSAISEMENLSSESTGEGADRRVVVRSTAPNALPDKPRGPRSGRSGGRAARAAVGRRSAPCARSRGSAHRVRSRPEIPRLCRSGPPPHWMTASTCRSTARSSCNATARAKTENGFALRFFTESTTGRAHEWPCLFFAV